MKIGPDRWKKAQEVDVLGPGAKEQTNNGKKQQKNWKNKSKILKKNSKIGISWYIS